MNEHDVDPLDRLSAELDVAPSPAFAAQVRARVQAERSPGVLNRWMVAAAALAVVGAVWFGFGKGGPEIEAPTAPNAAVAPPPSRGIEAPAAPDTVVPAVRPAAAARAARPRQARGPALRSTGLALEVLVPPDQMAGLQQLRAAILDGRLDPGDLPPNRLEWGTPEEPVLGGPSGPAAPPDSPFEELGRPDGTRYSE